MSINFVIKKILPFIRPYKVKVFAAVAFSFFLAAIGGLQVRLVRPLFDHGLSADGTKEDAYFIAAQLLGLGLLNFPVRFFHFYWLRFVMDRASLLTRKKIFSKLLRLPTSFYGTSKQGLLISNVINDTNIFAAGFKASIDLIREPLKAIVYLGMAFWADWQMTLLIFTIAPFLILIFNISGKKVRQNQGSVQKEHGELTHNIAEGLGANKITKAFNLQDFVFKRFNRTQENFFNSLMKTTFVEEIAHPLVEVVGAAAFAGVIIFAHFRISSGEVTTGEFVSFIAALALFMDPIRKFSQANVKLSQARAASDRIHHLLDLPEERDCGKTDLPPFNDKIEIKNLTFSYGEGDVLKNFNLEIKKGEKVALVGLSGSGKSTLINLLLGLYEISRGSIFIDGNDILDINLRSLRQFFGLVSQDIFLFNDSIIENLKVGGNFSGEQIDQSLDVSFASEFIKKLPQGLETIVGDRGTRLSGGQQQRITIARAFLQNTDILLFDEATSALDNESERIVQRALEKLAGDRTVIAVAHRLSTVQNFDKIIVMHDGKMVEAGTHEDLIQKGGEYAKLYDLSQNV